MKHAAQGHFPELDKMHYESNAIFQTSRFTFTTGSQKVALVLLVPLSIFFAALASFYHDKLKSGEENESEGQKDSVALNDKQNGKKRRWSRRLRFRNC